MEDKLCLLICDNYKHEAFSVMRSEGMRDVQVATFPVSCEHVQRDRKSLDKVIRSRQGRCSRIEVLGGACLNKQEMFQKGTTSHRIRKMHQCFYLFANRTIIDSHIKNGAHLQTPGFLQKWRRCMNEQGFDRKTAREFFRESTSRLILLDTGVNKNSSRQLKAFAGFVDRPYEIVHTGLDHFRLILKEIILEWRLETEKGKAAVVSSNRNRQLADYAMVSDLFTRLTGLISEEKVIDSIFEFFTMLYAPRSLVYLPYIDNKPGVVRTAHPSRSVTNTVKKRLTGLKKDHAWKRSGDGFLLRLRHQNKTVGVLEIDGLSFPEFREHFLNLALTISSVCGLAIDNARAYEKIEESKKLIQDSEREYRDLYDLAPVGYFTLDKKGKIFEVNLTGADQLGLERRALMKKPLSRFIHRDDQDKFYLHCNQVMKTKTRQTCGMRLKRKDSTEFYAQLVSIANKDFDGKYIQIRTALTDITDRVKAEETIRRSEEEYAKLLESISDGIAVLDHRWRYVLVNNALLLMTGKSREELLGTRIMDVFPGVGESRFFKTYERVMKTGKPEVVSDSFTFEDGRTGWFEVHTYPVPEGIFIIASDITDRKRAEDKLKKTAEELVRSNAELERFAYIASHDLKEPLRTITGFANLLENRYKDTLDKNANEYIDFIVDGANRMQQLIDDLLSYSQAAMTRKKSSSVDFNKLLVRSLSHLTVLIENKRAKVTNDSLPTMMVNGAQFEQLFQNLISNGIKFHREKPPRIHISADRKKSEWVFSVSDNGIGISHEDRKRVFGMFQRLHSRREYPGTGIGLAICQKIVELHGGRIWVESKPGKGSVFYFSVPEREV